MDRMRIDEVVIVEGKYDKIRLESLIDAIIITTDGFGVFSDREKQKLIRKMANERGLLVMTDSDAAGFVIRNFLAGCVEPSQIKHAYIPQQKGKEKRKDAPSKEGMLGVEGMSRQAILDAIERAGVKIASEDEPARGEITRIMLYDDGVIGGENSSDMREKLLHELDLPSHMSTNALLSIINLVTDEKQYRSIIEKIAR